jgi:type I restriction enzyme S subunit
MSAANWKTHDLGKLIAELESGSRPKGGADGDSGEIPSLGGENIRMDGRLDVSSVRKVPRSFFETMTKGVLRHEDVLINKDGANTGKVGIYRDEFPEAVINEHVFRLRGRDGKLDQGFLFYFLASQAGQKHIRARISGSAQPGLKASFVDSLPIALPADFDIQPAVVQVLKAVDRAIEQTEALLAKQQRIKAGLTHDLLTRGLDAKGELRDPATHDFKKSSLGKIPTEWDVVSLDSLVANNAPICYGIVQVGPDTPGGVPTIAIRDLGNITVSQVHHTERARESKFVRSRVVSGDLLLSIKATTGELGIVPPGFSGNISRDLARIRLQASDNPAYFKYQLQSDAGQRRLSGIIVGTTRREISIIPLRNLLVARPKKAEQDAIAERIQGTEKDMAALKTEFDKLLRLKAGLMQDLLTGRVPVTPLLAAKKN